LLRDLADNDRARRVGQPLELIEVLTQVRARAAALEGRSDEERPLDWLLNLYGVS
jgi:hypothetical protein